MTLRISGKSISVATAEIAMQAAMDEHRGAVGRAADEGVGLPATRVGNPPARPDETVGGEQGHAPPLEASRIHLCPPVTLSISARRRQRM